MLETKGEATETTGGTETTEDPSDSVLSVVSVAPLLFDDAGRAGVRRRIENRADYLRRRSLATAFERALFRRTIRVLSDVVEKPPHCEVQVGISLDCRQCRKEMSDHVICKGVFAVAENGLCNQ